MLIEYNGKSIETNFYTEVTEDERAELQKQFFAKPDFNEVKKQLKKISNDGVMKDKIDRYYFRDLMAKTIINGSLWSVEEVFQSCKVLGIFKAKTLKNEKVFPKNEPLIRNIDTAIRLGGSHYAKFPTNYPIKSVREILSKYGNKNNNYYDFSCGWGARLLGSLSLNKNYYGTDPNYLLVERLQNLTKDYKNIVNNSSIVDIRAQGSENFIPEWENTMGIAFSSPPYYNLEDYKIGEQSYKTGTDYESWKQNYLIPTIKNIFKYLVDDGYLCVNIKNFKNYNLIDDYKEQATKIGFKFITAESLINNKRMTPSGKIDNSEKIFIFQKKEKNTEQEISIESNIILDKEKTKENYTYYQNKNENDFLIDIYIFGAKSKKQLIDNNYWNIVSKNENSFLGEKYYALYNNTFLEHFSFLQDYKLGQYLELTIDNIKELLLYCIYHKDKKNSFKNVVKLCELLDNWEEIENKNYYMFLLCEKTN